MSLRLYQFLLTALLSCHRLPAMYPKSQLILHQQLSRSLSHEPPLHIKRVSLFLLNILIPFMHTLVLEAKKKYSI